MAERPDEYELDDYPERHEEDTDRPTSHSSEEKFFQENSLDGESYKSFRIRQQLIESNRVSRHTSFLDGRRTEIKILKRNILSSIFDIPYDEIDETKFDLMVEPVDIETFKLYYKKKLLLKYSSKDDRITILSEENLNVFKVKYANETIRRYSEKEMGMDFSTKSDLSAMDLEVRQAESEKYHRDLDRLQTKINKLENEKRQESQKVLNLQNQLKRARQQQNTSGYDYRNEIIRDLEQQLSQTLESLSIKDRKIGGLLDQLSRVKEDSNNEIEALNESLQIKSTQIIESQSEIKRLKENIENLEDRIRNSRLENLDELKKELDKNSEEYEEKLNEIREERDSYQNETEKLKEKLEKSMSEGYKGIQELVKKINEAHDERTKSILIQDSLKDKIIELESALRKYENLYASEKAISEDRELKLDEARKEIDELRKKSMEEIDDYLKMRNIHKEKIDALKNIIKNNEESIEEQRNRLERQRKTYDDIIEKNRVEIGSLRFEKRALEDTAANLSREIEQSENTNEVLTTQLDRVNNEIIELNGRMQELQTQNQTLTTELDTLVSNFGNLVAASETTNRNNTQEILKLNNKIKQLESQKDSIETYVNGLVESIDNYKHILDEAVEDKKKLKKEFEEEFDKLNREKESLVQDLKNKSKNEEDLMKKLWQNENNYSLLAQKYEKSFSKIDGLMTELDKASKREKSLKEEIKYKDSRIKVKNEEVNEKISEVEKLKKQIEDANLNIRNSDFFKQQFEQKKKELDEKTKEFNKLVQLTNRQDMDKDELTEEIRILQQEIADAKAEKELAQSKILPPETIEQMKHDIRN